MGSLDDVIQDIEDQYGELIERDMLRISPKTETERIHSVTIEVSKHKTIPQRIFSKLGLQSQGVSEDEAKELHQKISEIGEKHGFVSRPHSNTNRSITFRIEDE